MPQVLPPWQKWRRLVILLTINYLNTRNKIMNVNILLKTWGKKKALLTLTWYGRISIIPVQFPCSSSSLPSLEKQTGHSRLVPGPSYASTVWQMQWSFQFQTLHILSVLNSFFFFEVPFIEGRVNGLLDSILFFPFITS